MNQAFVIDARDNVATVLQAVEAGERLVLLGEVDVTTYVSKEVLRAEHKVALRPIPQGESIIKYGMPIGYATKDIASGEWVHLHNCASNYDERSSTLDAQSGAPTDIEYV